MGARNGYGLDGLMFVRCFRAVLPMFSMVGSARRYLSQFFDDCGGVGSVVVDGSWCVVLAAILARFPVQTPYPVD